MIPGVFSFMTDYHCNFECAHCSVGSSPRTKFPMPWELYEDVIGQLREIPTARVVVFTGGEATLRKEWLLDAIALATQAGFRTRLVTNAWWASTPDKARAFLGDLKEAGLAEINTSYDDYHAPFARIDKIVNFARAAFELNMKIAIAALVDENATWGAERIKEELSKGIPISREELDQKSFILEDYPTPSGTGETLDVSRLDGKERCETGCTEIVKTISIHPNGMVRACCGHALFYTPDLTLGDLKEEPLAPMLERAQKNVLYWWISQYGPKRILDKLGIGGHYGSICHACHALLSNPEIRAKLHEYLRANRKEIFLQDVLLSDNLKYVADVARAMNEQTLKERVRRLGNNKVALPVVR